MGNITAADVAQATGSRAKILAQNRTYSAPAALFGLINATTIQAARQKASKAAASTKHQAHPAQALQMVGGASYGSDSRIAKLMAFVGVEKPDQLRHILRIIMMTLSTNVGLPKLIIMWAVSV